MQPSDVNEKLIVLLESIEVNSFKEVTMEENQTQLKTQSCSTMLLVDISSITEQFDKKNILAAGTLQRQHGNGITINSVVAFVSICQIDQWSEQYSMIPHLWDITSYNLCG